MFQINHAVLVKGTGGRATVVGFGFVVSGLSCSGKMGGFQVAEHIPSSSNLYISKFHVELVFGG